MAQRVEGHRFDSRRCLLTAGYGAAFVGPFGHAWYMGLDRVARALFTPGTLAFIAGKVGAGGCWAFGRPCVPVAAAACAVHAAACRVRCAVRKPTALVACRPRAPARQVVADTAVFGPLHVAGYFTHMTLSSGGTWADAKAKLRSDFWPTFSAELTVWPVVQARAGGGACVGVWGRLRGGSCAGPA